MPSTLSLGHIGETLIAPGLQAQSFYSYGEQVSWYGGRIEKDGEDGVIEYSIQRYYSV